MKPPVEAATKSIMLGHTISSVLSGSDTECYSMSDAVCKPDQSMQCACIIVKHIVEYTRLLSLRAECTHSLINCCYIPLSFLSQDEKITKKSYRAISIYSNSTRLDSNCFWNNIIFKI